MCQVRGEGGGEESEDGPSGTAVAGGAAQTCAQGGAAGEVAPWGPIPEPALRPWVSVWQAHRASEALRHAFVDGRGPLWPWPDDLVRGPLGHLAGENRVTLSWAGLAQARGRGGV